MTGTGYGGHIFGDRDISPEGVIARMRDEKGADVYDLALLRRLRRLCSKCGIRAWCNASIHLGCRLRIHVLL